VQDGTNLDELYYLEHMPWTVPLFEEVPQPWDGEVIVPDRPGLGLRFDQDFIKRHGA
jgi:L-alanine-DL-glutamate epimerase-like enolase superfamily enzyme